MPRNERRPTDYKGVFYVESVDPATGKNDKIFYVRFKRNGKLTEEKAGRSSNAMTAAKASHMRADRMRGKEATNEERRDAIQAAKEAEAGRWTFSRLWTEYKAQRPINKALNVDDNRYLNYLAKPFGDKTPDEIITLDVDRLRIKMLKAKAPQTVKSTLALLKRCINFGVAKGLIDDPSKRRLTITLPEVHNQVVEMLSDDEARSLLEVLDAEENIQVANILKLAMFTGLRRGSLFRLQWGNIEFERKIIQLPTEAMKSKHALTIPLNSLAEDVLLSHPRTPGSEFVFPGKDGGERRNIQDAARRIRTKAGLPADFRYCHGLRHHFASMLASSGKINMRTLQDMLGHRTPAMSMRYGHMLDGTLRDAAEHVADVFKDLARAQEPKPAKVVDIAHASALTRIDPPLLIKIDPPGLCSQN